MKTAHQILATVATLTLVFTASAQSLAVDTGGTQNATLAVGTKGFKSKLTLNTIEKTREGISVDVANDADQPLKILGVQSSQSLFVVNFDKTIAPGKTGTVIVNYEAELTSTGNAEYIRLETNFGIRLLQVEIDRPSAVAIDNPQLIWSIGSARVTKSVALTISNKAAVIKEVRALGQGNSATLTDLGNGKYRIDIVPKSTEAGSTFPVLITYEPALPGAQRTIVCSMK